VIVVAVTVAVPVAVSVAVTVVVVGTGAVVGLFACAGDFICRSSNRDTGKIKVHILNVAAPVEKRDSTGEQASNLTSSTVRISSRLFSSMSLFFVTLCLLTRLEHLV